MKPQYCQFRDLRFLAVCMEGDFRSKFGHKSYLVKNGLYQLNSVSTRNGFYTARQIPIRFLLVLSLFSWYKNHFRFLGTIDRLSSTTIFVSHMFHKLSRYDPFEHFFRVYITLSKHEGGSDNSRQRCKPEKQSRVCKTFENSPKPLSV